jgi:membrane-associated phospholipid phosphatase
VGYLTSCLLLSGCFRFAFWLLSGCLLFAVALALLRMLLAVAYVVEYVVGFFVGYLAALRRPSWARASTTDTATAIQIVYE